MKKYIGSYAKRFYTGFKTEHIYKIVGFSGDEEYITVTDGDREWDWDMEDTIIISNEEFVYEVEGIANINSPHYTGYNPFE